MAHVLIGCVQSFSAFEQLKSQYAKIAEMICDVAASRTVLLENSLEGQTRYKEVFAEEIEKATPVMVSATQRVIAILELQGYLKPARADKWMTTLSGEDVAGSKPPRDTRERVEEALTELRQSRFRRGIQDHRGGCFRGFPLSDRPRVQSAEVRIQLVA